MSQSIHKKILFDFFDGKATAIQRKQLEAWLRDPVNEAYYYACLDEWESQHPQYLPDADAALESFRNMTKVPALDTEVPEQPHSFDRAPGGMRRWWAWGLAASVLLMVASGFVFQKEILYKPYRTGYAQTDSFRLPDRTRVALNANSVLWVPRWTFGRKREVILEGEGEFNVSHTADHKRFVVRTDRDFNVEVLGTEFVVFARPRAHRVVLNKGKVEVHYRQEQHTLRPGDVLTLSADAERPQLTKAKKPELRASWKNHQFYFDDLPLSEVALTLEEHFGLRVTIADSHLPDRRLSGYFTANSSQEIVEILSALLDVSIALQDNHLIIPKPKKSGNPPDAHPTPDPHPTNNL